MLIPLAAWPDLEARLAARPALVIPIGSTEQHGPTGPLGTDFLCPELIARRAHESADVLVGPTFAVGMAQHHLAFPGTFSLRPSTMIAALEDWTASARRWGIERIYFLNGHGGNVATIQAAFSEIYARASFGREPPGLRLRLRNWWELAGVGALCRSLYPEGHGSHASPSEIALARLADPAPPPPRGPLTPRIAGSGPIRDAADFRRRHPDGRMGSDPTLATPEAGARILALAAEALVREIREFEAEDAD